MNSVSHNFSAAAQPAPLTPVQEQMSRLRGGRESLHGLLDALEDRLNPILGARGPHAVEAAEKPVHESPLHGALMGEANEVIGAGQRIQTLLDRLTL